MAAINPAAAAQVPAPAAQHMPRTAPIEPDAETTSQPMLLRKSVLLQMLDSHDDLAAGLASSLGRSRGRSGSDEVRGSAWLEQMLEPEGPKKMVQLRQQLTANTGLGLAALRALLQASFADPSDQLVALRLLLGDADLDELHEDLALLEEELLHGPAGSAARAGFNVALKARRHATQLRTTPWMLRRSYRDFLETADIIETYGLWIEQYGHAARSSVVDFIDCALAADMYALDPGCNRLEFGQLLQRLRQLTTLRSADALLLKHCWNAATLGRCGIDAASLTRALLSAVGRSDGLQHLFEGVLAGVSLGLDATAKVRFMQGVRGFLRAIPHGLWPDLPSQVQLLDEVEAVLEHAIPLERRTAGVLRQVQA